MAYRAQQLLEHSLLSELRAIVARALSGLDMFAGGQLSELDLLGSDFLETTPSEQVSCSGNTISDNTIITSHEQGARLGLGKLWTALHR